MDILFKINLFLTYPPYELVYSLENSVFLILELIALFLQLKLFRHRLIPFVLQKLVLSVLLFHQYV